MSFYCQTGPSGTPPSRDSTNKERYQDRCGNSYDWSGREFATRRPRRINNGGGLGLGNGCRLPFGAFGGHHARVLPQPCKRQPAHSVRQQHSKSQRRSRRANQHQHIHCIQHAKKLSNSISGLSRPSDPAPSKKSRDPVCSSSYDVIVNRKARSLTPFSVAD